MSLKWHVFVISEKYRVRRLLAHSHYNLLTGLYSNTNLKQGVHIHQPTAWPVPHACAQPYHPVSGSHGQLFHPYWGSSAWHRRRVYERANQCLKDPLLSRRVKSTPLSASSMSTFRLYFWALFGTFFLKVFLEWDCNGKKDPCAVFWCNNDRLFLV